MVALWVRESVLYSVLVCNYENENDVIRLQKKLATKDSLIFGKQGHACFCLQRLLRQLEIMNSLRGDTCGASASKQSMSIIRVMTDQVKGGTWL